MKEKRSNRIIWIISLLLIFLGAAGLAAALLMPGGGTFQEEETEEVITFAVYGDTEMQRIGDQVAETFMNQNHCKVEIYCYPTEEEEREQVLGQLAGGRGFDVFYADPELLETLLENGELLNLEEVAQERAREGDVFYSTALEQGRIGDVQYALPTGVMPYMIYYNRTLLEERGLEDPQTVFREKRWDFSGFAAYLETARGSGEEPALAFEAEWESVEPFLRSQGGSCRVGENGIEPDALAEETAGTFGKLARQGVIRSCGGQEYADMQKAFAEGRLPMIVGGLEMTRLCSNVDFAWDILPFPSVESDFQNSSFEVPLIAAGNGEHGELARKFVSYYVSALGQKLRLENGECLIPSLNMVFYTSMGDVRFPEHSNYYFFAIENGYSSERAGVSETDRRRILDLWDGYMEEGT